MASPDSCRPSLTEPARSPACSYIRTALSALDAVVSHWWSQLLAASKAANAAAADGLGSISLHGRPFHRRTQKARLCLSRPQLTRPSSHPSLRHVP